MALKVGCGGHLILVLTCCFPCPLGHLRVPCNPEEGMLSNTVSEGCIYGSLSPPYICAILCHFSLIIFRGPHVSACRNGPTASTSELLHQRTVTWALDGLGRILLPRSKSCERFSVAGGDQFLQRERLLVREEKEASESCALSVPFCGWHP